MDKKQICHCSVKIEHLYVKKANNIILHDVNLTVNHGETLALIGRNGSGKTTLLKAILSKTEYKDNISFFDADGKKISSPRIGYVPQRLSFDKNTPITVLDMFCANSSKLPIWLGHSKNKVKQAEEILEKVGANQYLNKNIGRLSGGELQRVLLAFALSPIPDILLLDEPVSAVDRKGISVFYELLNSMRKEYHMPIIVVSHDLGHIRKYATYAALIDRTVIVSGKVDKIIKDERVRDTFGLNINGGEI